MRDSGLGGMPRGRKDEQTGIFHKQLNKKALYNNFRRITTRRPNNAKRAKLQVSVACWTWRAQLAS